MSQRNAVLAFDRFGREAGFEKKGGSWYRCSDEVVAVSNLQKSQYGPQYYWNQGFWLRELGGEDYPKVNRCHIFARLEDLLPDVEGSLRNLLDLEYELDADARIEELSSLLRARLLPLIDRASSLAGVCALLGEGVFARAAIMGPAQEALAPTQQGH
ncbi:MAG: hypothetical protein QOC92_102 [Acidimicrobiaceae bacterium]|jgi:hypothetical protein